MGAFVRGVNLDHHEMSNIKIIHDERRQQTTVGKGVVLLMESLNLRSS
jgi:hypothetical protein